MARQECLLHFGFILYEHQRTGFGGRLDPFAARWLRNVEDHFTIDGAIGAGAAVQRVGSEAAV